MRTSIIDKFAPLEGSAIHVQQLRCAKVRNRNVTCLKCADACTSGCISLTEGQLNIEANNCVGCGTCATVCPTGALESRNPSDAELMNKCMKARKKDHVVLMCALAHEALAEVVATGSCVQVVCAGRIDESLLCGLAAKGVRRVSVVCGHCNNCEQAHGLETARLVINTTRALLHALGVDMNLVASTEVPPSILSNSPDAQNTVKAQEMLAAFFSIKRANPPIRLASAPKDGLAQNPHHAQDPHHPQAKSFAQKMHVKKDGTLPHFIPDRRDQLLSYLSEMGETNEETINTRLWGMVVIDEALCSSCQMCATFCPTGALAKFVDTDGSFGINHYPGDCVKCRSCEDICRQKAISVLDEVSPELLLDGMVCRYAMKARDVDLGSPQQMADSLKHLINVPIKDFS